MTLPIDLVFIRHGQSEGNLAKRQADAGDRSMLDALIVDRHTCSYRLTPDGRLQADKAGMWLRKEFGHFDRHLVSEYIRALETAARLEIPNALWHTNYFLTERDTGDVGRRGGDDRDAILSEALRIRQTEPFFWKPPNGESFAELNLRLDRVLGTLHRECSDKRVLVVCHGEVMRGFRVLLERMPQHVFRQLYLSEEPVDRIYNCEILHYTRRNPRTHDLSPHLNWLRRIRPTENPIWKSRWQEITRVRYTNEELYELVGGERHQPFMGEYEGGSESLATYDSHDLGFSLDLTDAEVAEIESKNQGAIPWDRDIQIGKE